MKSLIIFCFIISCFNSFASKVPYCQLNESASCEQIIKSKLKAWDIRDKELMRRVKVACVGNSNGACVQRVIHEMSSLDVNKAEKLMKAARSCFLSSSSCVSFVFKKMSKVQKMGIDKLTSLSKSCFMVNTSCLVQKCEKKMCRNSEVLKNLARSCSKSCREE